MKRRPSFPGFFLIQDKSNPGYFLPECKKAYTHSWPTPFWIQPPRLFTTRRAAQQALNWWKKGPQIYEYLDLNPMRGLFDYADEPIRSLVSKETDSAEKRESIPLEVVEGIIILNHGIEFHEEQF